MDAKHDLITAYLAHCEIEKRLSPRTVALYRIALQKLQAFCDAHHIGLLDVPTPLVRRWVGQLRSAGRASNGIALQLSSWRGFYDWAGKKGFIATNPTADVRPPKKERAFPKALSVDQAMQLADYSPSSDTTDPWLLARDRAMVELLYGCGLRVSELIGLDRIALPTSNGWLDLDNGIAFVTGKGNKRRSVPLGPPAIAAIRHWLLLDLPKNSVASDGKLPIFLGRNGSRLSPQSIWGRLRKWGNLAGLPSAVHPHMLRHSYASHLLQSSGDLRAVQELLGHANITSTQIYTRLDFQHLSASYDVAHPRAKRKETAS